MLSHSIHFLFCYVFWKFLSIETNSYNKPFARKKLLGSKQKKKLHTIVMKAIAVRI